MKIFFYILISLIIVAILEYLIRKTIIEFREVMELKRKKEEVRKELFKILKKFENKVEK